MSAESKSVSAWACGICAVVHAEQSDADSCCTCTNCEQKFKKEGYVGLCPSCNYGSELRSARSDVERNRDYLNSARDRLVRLISNPPPGKKRPKDDVVPARDEVYTHQDGTLDSSAWAPLCEVRDWLLGLAERTGEAEAKKMADLVDRGIKRTGGG